MIAMARLCIQRAAVSLPLRVCQRRTFFAKLVGLGFGLGKKSGDSAASLQKKQSPPPKIQLNPRQPNDESNGMIYDNRWKTLSWGSGSDGKLGHGDLNKRMIPSEIALMTGCKVQALSAGVQHSVAIVSDSESSSDSLETSSGKLYGWGSNFFGQAGFMMEDQQPMSSSWGEDDDDLDTIELPNAIKLVSTDKTAKPIDINYITSGDFHNIALNNEGRVWSWGGGILGRGDEYYGPSPMEIEFFPSMKRRVLSIHAAGNISAALAVPLSAPSVSVTESHTNREVYLWGYFRDNDGNAQKSVSPILIADSLKFNRIWKVDASRDFVIVTGSRNVNGKDIDCTLLYGHPDMNTVETPGYPYFNDEIDPIDKFYKNSSYAMINLSDAGISCSDIKRICVWKDKGLILLRNGGLFHFSTTLKSTNQPASSDSTRPIELQVPRLIDPAKGPITQITLNAFGLVALCAENGRVLHWPDFCSKSIDQIESYLLTSGIVAVENGAHSITSGWDHGLASIKS